MDTQTQIGGFVGTFLHALDGKKRLTIPALWRELVGVPQSVLVMPGVDVDALYVFPVRDLQRRIDAIRQLSIANEEGRRFARALAARSERLDWDSQGRIRVRDELLARAGITAQAVLVGNFEGFELWSPERWEKEAGGVDNAMLKQAARTIGF